MECSSVWSGSGYAWAGINKESELTEEEKQQIREDLKAAVTRAFDLKLLMQQKEVERLEKKLEELKALLAKRKEARTEVIDKRVEWLTGETKHLEW